MEEEIAGGVFAQTKNDTWKKNITCHKCGKKGHLAWECKSKNKPEQVHANLEEEDSDKDKDENLFVQHKTKGVVNKNYLLLDNQSTVDQIANPDPLTNIRKSQKLIVVHCNAGKTKSDLEGELGDMMVHHNPKSIAMCCPFIWLSRNTGSPTIAGIKLGCSLCTHPKVW